MGLVKFIKLTNEKFLSLEHKDENSLYFVNEYGDFSNESLEVSGDLYLGEKVISKNISITDVISDLDSSSDTVPSPKAVKNYVDEATSLGYAYMGIATPAIIPSQTIRKMFYIASQNGDYTYFGLTGVVKYSLLMWNGKNWSVENTDVMTIDGHIVQELGKNHDKVMSQASVTAEVKNVLEKFTWKNINT